METSYVQNMLATAFGFVSSHGFHTVQCFTPDYIAQKLNQISYTKRREKNRQHCLDDLYLLENTAITNWKSNYVGRLRGQHETVLPFHQYGRWAAERSGEIIEGIRKINGALAEEVNLERAERLAFNLSKEEEQQNECSYILIYLAALGYSISSGGSRNKGVGSKENELEFLEPIGPRPRAFASKPRHV